MTNTQPLSARTAREMIFDFLRFPSGRAYKDLFTQHQWQEILNEKDNHMTLLAPLILLDAQEEYMHILQKDDLEEKDYVAFSELREALEIASAFNTKVSDEACRTLLPIMDEEHFCMICDMLMVDQRFNLIPFCDKLRPNSTTYNHQPYQVFGEACLVLSRSGKRWEQLLPILEDWVKQGLDINKKPSQTLTHLLYHRFPNYDLKVIEKMYAIGIDPSVQVAKHTGQPDQTVPAFEKMRNDAIKSQRQPIVDQMNLWQSFLLKNEINLGLSTKEAPLCTSRLNKKM